MILTYRPEFVPSWGGKSFHSQVTLNRLTNRETLAAVGHILGSDNISDDLQELILAKTEGVPFFIEELVRSLKDMGIIKQTNDEYHLAKDIDRLTIPSTIQDVIMARVDSLPEGPKDLLQAGSTIEREFSYELIKAVTGLPEQELLHHLSVLKDAELLYERGNFPTRVASSNMRSPVRSSTTRYWLNQRNCFIRRSVKPSRNSTETISAIITGPW